MLETITKSMFAENVNSTFHLQNETGQPLELVLIECREGVATSKYEQFSLMFKGPNTALPQRTYELAHPVLGTFALFLVPVRQDINGTYYESVFNRLIRQKTER